MLFTGVEPNNAETFRFAINPGTTGLKDYYFDLSLAPSSFWKFVKTTGEDIRVTFSDGQTLVPRELVGFDVPSKIGSLFIANHSRSVLGTIGAVASFGSGSEAGMQWSSSVAGQVVEIRLYRGLDSTARIARLWTGSGTLLATVTMPATTIKGWQVVALATPVNITAGSIYVVSYTSSVPYQNEHFFDSAYNNPPLHAPIGAGVWGSAGTFPTNNYLNSNYFIDVGFTTSAYYGMPFYVHYGNPNIVEPAAALGGKTAVWESSLGLVAHLEAATDSTQWGTIVASPTPPTFGQGVLLNGGNFNGSSQFLNLNPYPFPFGKESRSFAFWMKKHDTGLAAQIKYGYEVTNQMNLIYVDNTALYLAFYFNDHVIGTVTLDTWQHWVVTYDGTTLTAYRNGSSVYSNPITAPNTSSDTPNYIGLYYNWYMNGSLDEMRVYSRCLSAAEVAGLYANQNAPNSFWLIGAVQPSGLIV